MRATAPFTAHVLLTNDDLASTKCIPHRIAAVGRTCPPCTAMLARPSEVCLRHDQDLALLLQSEKSVLVMLGSTRRLGVHPAQPHRNSVRVRQNETSRHVRRHGPTARCPRTRHTRPSTPHARCSHEPAASMHPHASFTLHAPRVYSVLITVQSSRNHTLRLCLYQCSSELCASSLSAHPLTWTGSPTLSPSSQRPKSSSGPPVDLREPVAVLSCLSNVRGELIKLHWGNNRPAHAVRRRSRPHTPHALRTPPIGQPPLSHSVAAASKRRPKLSIASTAREALGGPFANPPLRSPLKRRWPQHPPPACPSRPPLLLPCPADRRPTYVPLRGSRSL